MPTTTVKLFFGFSNWPSFPFQVAFQEQLNIREGRPTMFAASTDVRAPAVINDRFLQQVFSANMPGGRTVSRVPSGPIPRSITGILGYMINFVFQYFYSTLTSIVSAFVNLGGGNEARLVTDPLGDVMTADQPETGG